MGGLVCGVRRFATLQYQAVPTDPAEWPAFDSQMRRLLSDIADTVVSEAPENVKMVCRTLGKRSWTLADRTNLFDVVESLYPEDILEASGR